MKAVNPNIQQWLTARGTEVLTSGGSHTAWSNRETGTHFRQKWVPAPPEQLMDQIQVHQVGPTLDLFQANTPKTVIKIFNPEAGLEEQLGTSQEKPQIRKQMLEVSQMLLVTDVWGTSESLSSAGPEPGAVLAQTVSSLLYLLQSDLNAFFFHFHRCLQSGGTTSWHELVRLGPTRTNKPWNRR